jgi:hypothetical protein
MDDSPVEEALETAEEAFDARPGETEPDLNVDDALLHLRKACRLLEAADRLRGDRYYTLVIESSFVAIEQSLQGYLVYHDLLDAGAFVDHEDIYERGAEANLYSGGLRDRLLELWRRNRSRVYYRDAVPDRSRADALLDLAREVHDHVLGLASLDHECVCERESR